MRATRAIMTGLLCGAVVAALIYTFIGALAWLGPVYGISLWGVSWITAVVTFWAYVSND